MALKVSQGSGATLATNVLNGEHLQIISPVSLHPLPASPNFIGLISAASIHGKVDVVSALPAGANYIGLTTTILAGSLPAGTNFLGGVTIFGNIGTSNTGNVTINPGPNYIGLVTSFPAAATTYIGLVSISGNVNVASALPAGNNNIGDVDVASLPALPAGANYIGLATVDIGSIPTVTVNTHAVTQSGNWNVTSLASGAHVNAHLETGGNFIGGVSIFGAVNLSQVTLNPSPNFIGLTTTVIGNTPAVSQSGTWNVGVNGLISLASGTKIGLDAGTNFIGGVSVFGSLAANLAGNVTLNPGPNYIGLVTAFPAAATTYIGLVSVSGNVAISNTPNVAVTGLISLASGTLVGLNAGNNNIGDVDVASLPALPTGANYIGLVTASIVGSVNMGMTTLFPGPNFIGLVTSVIGNTPAVSQSGTWNVGITGLTSLASGTLVGLNAGNNNIGDVDVASIAAGDNNIGNVDVASLPALPAGANYIGLVTASIVGTVNTGMTTLFPGPNWIGLATVWMSNKLDATNDSIAVMSLASGAHIRAYLETGSNFIGGVSVFGNLAANLAGNVTLNPSPNYIGLVTIGNVPAVSQSGTWNVGITGLTSLASGTLVGLNAGNNNIGDVDVASLPALPTGANYIGLVTASIVGSVNMGMTTLFPGPNFIGLVTSVIGNTPAVSQSGTWNVGVTGLISLASGTLVGLNAGTNAIGKLAANSGVDIGDVDVASIAAGTNIIGKVRVVDDAGEEINVTGDSDANGGATTLAVHARAALYNGTSWDRMRGDTTNGLDVDVTRLPALPAGANYIGLATVVPAYVSTYTSLTTVYSATGNATLFVPPAGKRWILKNLRITALGRNEVEVKSGAKSRMAPMALATTSGITEYYGESGWRADAADEALVFNLLSTATITVWTNVRFE